MVIPQSVQGHTCLTHHFLFFDIRALWRSGLSAREPECQKLKNGGLDYYGPEQFGGLILLQSEKCGTERVNIVFTCFDIIFHSVHSIHPETPTVSAATLMLPRRKMPRGNRSKWHLSLNGCDMPSMRYLRPHLHH